MEKCQECGSRARVRKGSYAYKESGLDNVTLESIEFISCSKCGNEDPVISHVNELRSVIAEALISKPARLSGKELRYLRKYLELSSREFSRLIHVDPATLSRWENGDDPIGPQSDLVVRALIAAKKEENYDELVDKLNALDEKRSALDLLININTETNEFEYV